MSQHSTIGLNMLIMFALVRYTVVFLNNFVWIKNSLTDIYIANRVPGKHVNVKIKRGDDILLASNVTRQDDKQFHRTDANF